MKLKRSVVKLSTFLSVFLAISVLSGIQLRADVNPPDLYCVDNDTLRWEIPTLSCGTYEGYEIFMSNSRSGPYTSVGTFYTPGEVEHYVDNATAELRYYFMQSLATCPGEEFLQSDTLDNQLPPAVSIQYVTVVDDRVKVVWDEIEEEEEFYYRILRATDVGTIIVGETDNETEYEDASASPRDGEEIYHVVSVDNCENQSLYDNSHHTLYISDYELNGCEGRIELSHNPYDDWGTSLKEYRSMVSIDGAEFEENMRYKALSDAAVQGIVSGVTYRIRVEALHENGEWVSASQAIELTPDFERGIDSLDLLYASFAFDKQNVFYSWKWNEDASIQSVWSTYFVGDVAIAYDTEYDQSLPFPQTDTLYDLGPVSGNSGVGMNVEDVCSATSSKVFPLIYLSVEGEEHGELNISWRDIRNEIPGGLEDYFLIIYRDSTPDYYSPDQILNMGENSSYSYTIPSGVSSEMVFLIESKYHHEEGIAILRSNTVRYTPSVQLFFPTGLSPDGINRQFKAQGLALETFEDFQMQIFSREGKLIFETDDIHEAWNGRINERFAPLGIYVYRVTARQGGRNVEYSGQLQVIY